MMARHRHRGRHPPQRFRGAGAGADGARGRTTSRRSAAARRPRPARRWCSGRAPASASARWCRPAGSGCRCPAKAATSRSGRPRPDEFPLWANIEPEHGRISAEALLCGRGLVRLYRAVADDRRRTARASRHRRRSPRRRSPAPIRVAVRTVSLYCRLLGRLAGDMALIFMARGGAYIGGGIPPRILPFLHDGEFRRAFEAKAPHQAVMAAIPSFVIVAREPGAGGARRLRAHAGALRREPFRPALAKLAEPSAACAH